MQASLTYSHEDLPDGASYDPDTQLFRWTPSYSQAGVYSINFSASDDGDGTGTPSNDSTSIQLRILDANGRPNIQSIDNRSINVGSSLQIPVQATDPEGGPISLRILFGQSNELPAWASFVDGGNGTGTLTVEPQPGHRGDYLITFEARETSGASPLTSSTQFVLSVLSANEPPVLLPLFDRVVLPDQLLRFPVYATDLDEDGLTFSAEGLPPGASLIPSTIYGQAFVEWSPTSSHIGDHSITFRVTDSGNGNSNNSLSSLRTISLKVRATNARPSLEPIGQQTVREGELLSIQMVAQDSDNDQLSYSANLIDNGQVALLPRGATFDPQTGSLRWRPDYTQAGDYRFRLTVTDGPGTRSEDVLVRVLQTNQLPVFNALPKLFGREGESLFFAVSANDPDGEPLVYQLERVDGDWQGTGLPPGLRFDASERAVLWQADYDQAGTYRLHFSAVDSSGSKAQATVVVQVMPTNRAPELALPGFRIAEIGRPIEIAINAVDLDGDTLTLVGQDLPAGAILGNDRILRWTPLGSQEGQHYTAFGCIRRATSNNA